MEKLAGLSYPIWVGSKILSELPSLELWSAFSRIHVIYERKLESLTPSLLTSLPSGATSEGVEIDESSKNIQAVSRLWEAFLRANVDRGSVVVVAGGGVLCDAAAFACATFMRGCAVFLLPSTLLAQVDASVGAKSGVNFGGIKNLVGTICEPAGVLVDTAFLRTLPRRHLCSGKAEMIKHGLILDLPFFESLEHSGVPSASAEFTTLVKRSIELKISVVANDPTERGLRKILNFGHTIGHALESLALEEGVELLHGEAVALGMNAEAFISHRLGWISEADLHRIVQCLRSSELPEKTALARMSERLRQKMLHDKKNRNGELRFSLLQRMGESKPDCLVSDAQIQAALEYISIP